MHQNNPHKDPYNFELLLQVHTSLEAFVFTNKYKARTIDFANPKAVLLIFRLSLKSIKNKPKTCLTPKEIKTTKHAANKVIIAVLE